MSNEKVWNKIFSKYQKSSWINKPSIFAQEVTHHIKGKKTLLDLGAGLGQDSKYYYESGFKVTWADTSDQAMTIAKDRVGESNANFLLLDLEKELPFEKESFDVVYSHLALHYFDDDRTRELFKEIHHILKKDGVFAALFNSIDDPEINTDHFTNIEDNYYQEDIGIKKRYFSVDYLNEIVEGLFDPIIIDNKGKTYKDEIESLIRFVGKKK